MLASTPHQHAESVMDTTTTRITFERFAQLPENEGITYELDEGELLTEPCPPLRHNLVRQRISWRLADFVEAHELGLVVGKMDFRLAEDTVRHPDVAFIDAERARSLDLDRSPAECAPTLAVEVVSPHNRANDMARKTHQYLRAGCRAVWVVYPSLRMIEIHTAKGVHQINEPEMLQDESLLPGLSLSLSHIFDISTSGK